MPTFIKQGFWEQAKKGYDKWLNLDNLIAKIISNTPSELPYKVYTALLSQNGEEVPVSVILENTINDIELDYINAGIFKISSSLFHDNEKVFIQIGKPNTAYASIAGYIDICQLEGTDIYINTKDFEDNVLSNGVLALTPIEIRVYN